MCLTTIALIGLGASAAGTGVSALGAINSANATRANATFQGQVAKNNQIVAEQNAAYASQAGSAAVMRSQLQQRAQTGGVAAQMGAEGLDINTGSPAAVRTSAGEIGQLNTENTAQSAALNVYGYQTQGVNFGAQAGLEEQEAAQAPIAGDISASGTLLSGAGSLASKWSGLQTPTPAPSYNPGVQYDDV